MWLAAMPSGIPGSYVLLSFIDEKKWGGTHAREEMPDPDRGDRAYSGHDNPG
jgi:hypothetical protein